MRYVIGIDLGTTNSCAAFADTQIPHAPIQTFPIIQLVAPGMVEARPLLPSTCYLATDGEWPKGAIELPWSQLRNYFVGTYALEHGAKVPTRLISSAKSWLCHAAVGRSDPILPPSSDPALRISPVEATARYLKHIADAWNHIMAKGNPVDEFSQQEVIITVPASFDEVARALTLEAAKKAGYGSVTMLEEPQAAYYNWMDENCDKWNKILKHGDNVLVCDVGGGTTDFSIIEVKTADDTLCFQRMAVGDHLLLGGENIDTAIAHILADKLNIELTPTQWLQLVHHGRLAKELLLGSKTQQAYKATMTGTGSKVVGGSLTVEISQEDVQKVVKEGFFGEHAWNEALQHMQTRGVRTMGLPYEDEPSISKHLAAFLDQHSAKPTHVLFNGGTMKPPIFQQAILNNLKKWFPDVAPVNLSVKNFDQAVARGAAYYGKVRRGLGVRIKGGSSRGYYLLLDVKEGEMTTKKALTLLSRGVEDGVTYTSPQTFWLKPNTPISFEICTSHIRLNDQPGDLIAFDDLELHRLPPIQTILKYGKQGEEQPIPVQIGIGLTAIGTLEIWLQATKSNHKWALEFQLRGVEGQENNLASIGQTLKGATYDVAFIEDAGKIIEAAFSKGGDSRGLMEALENAVNLKRKEWSLNLLRGLWPSLIKCAPQRLLSSQLAERWWNLAGFLLRPGYGYPLDDFRIKDLWKIILADIKRPSSIEVLVQQLICFRRIAGGLSKGQQIQVASEHIPQLNPNKNAYLFQERLRTIAAMELIDINAKIKVGESILPRILSGKANPAEYWSLGRIGARHLLKGSMGHVIPPKQCTTWVEKLLVQPISDNIAHLLGQLARLTGHREIDLPESLQNKIVKLYPQLSTSLLHLQTYTERDQEEAFGEALPPGLSLTLD